MRKIRIAILPAVLVVGFLFLIAGNIYADTYKKYDYPASKFSISFPSDWEVSETGRGCRATSEKYFAMVDISSKKYEKADLDSVFKTFCKEIKRRLPENYRQKAVKDLKIDGHKAKLLEISATINGNDQRVRYYLTSSETRDYLITMVSGEKTYKKAFPRFDRILRSIKFQK